MGSAEDELDQQDVVKCHTTQPQNKGGSKILVADGRKLERECVYLFGGQCLFPLQMQIQVCSCIQRSSFGLFSSAVHLCQPNLIKEEQVSPV
jgi:hypothetical protein